MKQFVVVLSAVMLFCAFCGAAFAEVTVRPVKGFEERKPTTHNDNPWGLVYGGALTGNAKGKVNIHPIAYELNGIKIAANVYTPADYDPARKYPAVTVAHPTLRVRAVMKMKKLPLFDTFHGLVDVKERDLLQRPRGRQAAGNEPGSLDTPFIIQRVIPRRR